MTTTQDAPRFALGQQVRVISNHGGLYSAQIGVVGVIAKQRQKRRYSYRSYDLAYTNERGAERILIVREDDLEAVGDASVEETPTLTPEKSARFSAGQQVRVISVDDAHLVGVVGSIVRERPPRRWNQRTYDFAYSDDEGREVLVYGIREDDLEAVADESPATAIPEQLAEKPAEVAALFRIGQRVTVHPPVDGLDDAYPSFTHYPVVGEIVSACLVTADGVHCYDVRFPRIERGVSTESWPPVSIREAHLVPEPSPTGWMAASAARTTKAERPVTPLPEPKFSVGEHVSVDLRSDRAYAAYTRKGAIGVIVGIGKPVRGIRRYDVQYDATGNRAARRLHALGLPTVAQIREEHLVKAEALAPVTTTEQQVERQAEQDATERRHADWRAQDIEQVKALLALAPHDAAHWLAKWLIRTDVERGYSEREISNGHHGAGGSLGSVNVGFGGKIVVRRIGPPDTWVEQYGYSAAGYDHHETFSLHRIYEELRAELRAPARQMSLWGSEVGA